MNVINFVRTGLAIVLVFVSLTQTAFAACSTHLGKVVFNEVFDPASGSSFLEIKTVDPSVVTATNKFAGWKIAVYKNNSSTKKEVDLSSVFTDIGKNSCGQNSAWIRIPDTDLGGYINGANPGSNLNFVMYETAGNKIVDVLRLGAASSFYGAGTTYSSCPTIESALPSAKYDAAWGSNGNKDWYRDADGTGAWGGQGTSNNSDTECANNNGGSAFSMSKTANATTVALGDDVTYTIYAQNGAGGSSLSTFYVTDNVPTGLTYKSCVAPSGGSCGTVFGVPYLWPCSSGSCTLAAGAQLTGSFTFTATATGTITNTASGVSGFTTKASDTATVTVTGGAPTITTVAGSALSSTSVTLNGTVNPNGNSTTVSFGYSTVTGSYTSTCTPTTSTYTGSSSQSFSCTVTGLTCGTTYFFRATGTSSAGSSNGSELNVTPACTSGDFDAYETNLTAPSVAAAIIKTHAASSTGICVYNGSCQLKIGSFNTGTRTLTTGSPGKVKIEIVDASSGSCAGFPLIALVDASKQLQGDGETPVTLPAVTNAYPNARIRITYPDTGTVIKQSCSSDNFAIRPVALTLTATDATVSTAGSARSLTSGANTHKAGTPFTMNATATVAGSGAAATNYVGTVSGLVTASVTTTSPTGVGKVDGTLNLGTWSSTGASTGQIASSTVTYSEVGTITAVIEDRNFSDVDANDGSTGTERYISGTVTGLGRFTPDHFTTAVIQGCSTFTYSGQPFTTNITAYNGLATPTATKNYGLTTNTVTLTDVGTATNLTNNTVASSLFNVSTPGVATATPTYTFAPTARATAPTPIVMRATDADAITSVGYETSATTTIRSGRARLTNAYGSEKLPLALPVAIEYYDAPPTASTAGWRTGTDTCTTLSAANFGLTDVSASGCGSNVSSCLSALTVSGGGAKPTVTLGVPTGTGSACVTLNLTTPVVGNQCVATGATSTAATSAGYPWLQYPWTSSAATNPTARATFGKYKSPIIYRRENY